MDRIMLALAATVAAIWGLPFLAALSDGKSGRDAARVGFYALAVAAGIVLLVAVAAGIVVLWTRALVDPA